MNDSLSDLSTDCGTDFSADPTVVSFKYYCGGLLVTVFGLLGLLGNILAITVLARPRLRDCFHQLLLALAVFDVLYITFGGINYTFKAFEARNEAFTLALPIIYPFTNIAMNATIFMTTAISIERFLGICYPLHLPPHNRKSWFYILPVLLLSFVLNVPKFLEGEIQWYQEPSTRHGFDEELNVTVELEEELEEQDYQAADVAAYRPTDLRKNSNYIKFYKTYFRLFSTAVIPFLVLIVINARIIIELKKLKPKSFGSHRKLWREINMFLVLLCIVVIFICCHVPRVIIDIWEFSYVEIIVQCNDLASEGWGHPFLAPRWIDCLTHFSHLAGILSSSTNFLIYCFIGHNFRKEFLQLIGLHKRTVEGSEGGATFTSRGEKSTGQACGSFQGSTYQGSTYQGVTYQPCKQMKPC